MPELPAGFTETPSLPAGFSEAPPPPGFTGAKDALPPPPSGFSEPPPPPGFTEVKDKKAPKEEKPDFTTWGVPTGWKDKVIPVDKNGNTALPDMSNKFTVKRVGGGIWYGPEQGNNDPKGGWFDAEGHKLPNEPVIDLGATRKPQTGYFKHDGSVGYFPTPGYVEPRGQAPTPTGVASFAQPNMQSHPGAPGGTQITPEASQIVGTEVTAPVQQAARFYSHVAPNALGARAAGNLVNKIQQNKQDIIASDETGLASKLATTSDIMTQILLAEGIGLPGAIEGASAPWLVRGGGYLSNILRGAQGGVAGGAAFGMLHGLTHADGVDNTDTSLAGLPGYLGRGLGNTLAEGAQGSAVGGVLGAAIPGVLGARQAIRAKINPLIADTGQATEDILATAKGDPTKANPTSIADLERAGTPEAKAALRQIRLNAAREHGIVTDQIDPKTLQPVPNLSRGDITQDALQLEHEGRIQGKWGSGGNKQRITQGKQVEAAIENLEGGAKEGVVGDVSKGLQNDMQNQYRQAIAQDIANHDNLYSSIEASDKARMAQGLPSANRIDPSSVIAKIDEIAGVNNRSLARDPALATKLETLKARLLNPGSDLSIKGVKGSVTQLESDIEGMMAGERPNRFSANQLRGVKKVLDSAADEAAVNLLGTDKPVIDASEFHRKSVVPFRDTDSGLPQILEGAYPDKATKVFLGKASPDQFEALTRNLSPEGRDFLKIKMLEAAREAGTKGGEFKPQAWAKYLSERSDHTTALFGDDLGARDHFQGLVHLTQSLPSAGTAVSAPLSDTMNRLGRHTLAGALGFSHSPLGAAGATALEFGVELGHTSLQGKAAFSPRMGTFPNNALPFDVSKVEWLNAADLPTGDALSTEYLRRGAYHRVNNLADFAKVPEGGIYRDSKGQYAQKLDDLFQGKK